MTSAYLSRPDHGPGPGVLVVHSWWGLTDGVRDVCDRLSAHGFAALAPDLFAGETPGTSAEAQAALAVMDPNLAADVLLSSLVALRAVTDDPSAPVAVVGFSSGGSWALWLATRAPDSVRGTVTYYGVTDLDFDDMQGPVLAHLVIDDEVIGPDDGAEFEAFIGLAGVETTVLHYEGVQHGFAEPGTEAFDAEGAEAAWAETIRFLEALYPSTGNSSSA